MGDLEPPERFLCETHSSRVTAPRGCSDCALEKRLTLLTRRVEELEHENEQLRRAFPLLWQQQMKMFRALAAGIEALEADDAR